MKRILITIFVLAAFINLKAQIINGNNNYAIVPIDNDSINVYFLQSGQTLITNANDVLGDAAYAADTTEILDVMSEYKTMLDTLPNNGIVQRNAIYIYDTSICRIIQTHERSSVAHYNPYDVPALYLFRSPVGCPEWVQPTGGHDAYNIGDCVIFDENEYESLIDANVWSPSIYPAGWVLKE